jgi:hypothetical protein
MPLQKRWSHEAANWHQNASLNLGVLSIPVAAVGVERVQTINSGRIFPQPGRRRPHMARTLLYDDHRSALLGALVTVARTRRTTTYTELVSIARLPLDLRNNPIHRNLLSRWLLELAKEDDAAGRPILPALVVRSGSGLPGPGFYVMLQELGRDRTGESEADAHAREVAAVFVHYDDRRELIPAWVEPARDRDRAVIEDSRSPCFNLLAIRYPAPRPEFLLVHTDASSAGRAGRFVSPQWLTGTWALLPSISYYRFLLQGDPTFWVMASWSPDESGRRVRIALVPEDGKVVAVRKAREYADGSMAFEVIFSDGETTWGEARRQGDGSFDFFGHDYHRPGWPEPPLDMMKAAFENAIPGGESTGVVVG